MPPGSSDQAGVGPARPGPPTSSLLHSVPAWGCLPHPARLLTVGPQVWPLCSKGSPLELLDFHGAGTTAPQNSAASPEYQVGLEQGGGDTAETTHARRKPELTLGLAWGQHRGAGSEGAGSRAVAGEPHTYSREGP